MEAKKAGKKYIGKQFGKIKDTHKRRHKGAKHKDKPLKKRKIKHYRHLKEQ